MERKSALITPTKISAEVYETLLDRLLRGQLKPGERLREVQVAEELGVSPTPVREAFARLEQDGLIEILPRRGAVVAVFTEQDIRELHEFRELLEVHAVQAFLQPDRFNPQHPLLRRMEEIIREGQRLAARQDARVKYNKLDVELHDTLIQLSGNRRLMGAYRTLVNQIQRVRLQTVFLPGRPVRSQQEHEQLVAAIVKGQADTAVETLRVHIRGTARALLEAAFEAKAERRG